MTNRISAPKLNHLPEIQLPRIAWAVISLPLIAATILLAVEYSAGWIALAFALMPDIGLIAGLSKEFKKGRLLPRAVPLYNALHRLIGPVAMFLLAGTSVIGDWGYVAGLSWATHVAFDRALGYRLRTPDGFVRH